jgi:hypothetical protein
VSKVSRVSKVSKVSKVASLHRKLVSIITVVITPHKSNI